MPDPTLPLPFKDQFFAATIDPAKWASVTNVTISSTAPKPISPTNVAAMLGIASMVTMEIDVPTILWPEPVFVNLWVGTNQVEAGEALIIDAVNNGGSQWTNLGNMIADGLNSAPMKPLEFVLPQSLYGSKFKLRITSIGNDGFDLWYVDDPTVTKLCLTDLDNSGTLDFFDFLAFQTAFSFKVDRADWDRDGQHTFFDFLAFQNSFAQGCY